MDTTDVANRHALHYSGPTPSQTHPADVTGAFFSSQSFDELLAIETLTTSATKTELFVIEGVLML